MLWWAASPGKTNRETNRETNGDRPILGIVIPDTPNRFDSQGPKLNAFALLTAHAIDHLQRTGALTLSVWQSQQAYVNGDPPMGATVLYLGKAPGEQKPLPFAAVVDAARYEPGGLSGNMTVQDMMTAALLPVLIGTLPLLKNGKLTIVDQPRTEEKRQP